MKLRNHRWGLPGILLCAAGVAGCSSITGLDGSSQYACKAPEGVRCDSVSGNYYNALQNNLPAQRKPTGTQSSAGLSGPPVAPPVRNPDRTGAATIPTAVTSATSATGSLDGSAFVAAPLRAGPRVLRLWIKSWEDADRDLNGESLVYVQVNNGRWLVDHVQRQAREPYAPVRPTRQPTSAGKGSTADSRESDPRSAWRSGPSSVDDGSAVSQALRALQGRSSTPATPSPPPAD